MLGPLIKWALKITNIFDKMIDGAGGWEREVHGAPLELAGRSREPVDGIHVCCGDGSSSQPYSVPLTFFRWSTKAHWYELPKFGHSLANFSL